MLGIVNPESVLVKQAHYRTPTRRGSLMKTSEPGYRCHRYLLVRLFLSFYS